jgi:septal ring factor EnvC (AmiA/AmiB activator)
MGIPADNRPWPRPDGPRLRRIAVCAALIGAAAALLTLALPHPAAAQGLAELTSKADDARHRAEVLAGEIEAQTGALAAKREQAGAAANSEAQLSTTLEVGRQRAAELADAFDEARERLRKTRAELRGSVAALADRMVAIYKAGGPDAIELLLSSDGYDDLATRAEYLERIRAADAALIERARDLRAQVNRQLDDAAAAREEQETYNAQVSAARDQIAAVRAQAEARAAALAGARSSREAALGELRGQIERWERQVQETQRVSAAEAQQQVADWVKGWAIPEQIVLCESGGNFDALNPSSGAGGAYQILPSTWKLYGGKGLPHEASPEEQTRIAALIWADSGAGAWECAG